MTCAAYGSFRRIGCACSIIFTPDAIRLLFMMDCDRPNISNNCASMLQTDWLVAISTYRSYFKTMCCKFDVLQIQTQTQTQRLQHP